MNLLAVAKYVEAYPNSITPLHITDIKNLAGLLDYYSALEAGFPEKESTPIKTPLACSQCGAKMPLYLISNEYYCLSHIPKHILFPIGLHGDEYKQYKEGQDGKTS